MGLLRVYRLDPESSYSVAAELQNVIAAPTSYRLFGGCESATVNSPGTWTDTLELSEGDAVRLEHGGQPVWSGYASKPGVGLKDTQHSFSLQGWWKRVGEIQPAVENEQDLGFGPFDGSDYPDIKTAFGVVGWLIDALLASPECGPITIGNVVEPDRPCKLSGPFTIRKDDNLASLFETLATMEDCVCGIDGNAQFYYIPRQTILDQTPWEVQLRTAPASGWRGSTTSTGIDGSLVPEDRGPANLAIRGAQLDGDAGLRMYSLAGVTNLRTIVMPPARNLRTGAQARRYARGLFRRFSETQLKLEDIAFFSGPRLVEPQLQPVRITDAGDEVTVDLAGSVDVDWLPYFHGKLTIGENKTDAGSGNPINDPFADTGSSADDPALDTGDSDVIDMNDGFDGDGDNFHDPDTPEDTTDAYKENNPDDALDYGTDKPAAEDKEDVVTAQQVERIPTEEDIKREGVWIARVDTVNPSTASLSGKIFSDRDSDGIKEESEPYVRNIWVVVKDSKGVERKVSTNSAGVWTLNNVPWGSTKITLYTDPAYTSNAYFLTQGFEGPTTPHPLTMTIPNDATEATVVDMGVHFGTGVTEAGMYSGTETQQGSPVFKLTLLKADGSDGDSFDDVKCDPPCAGTLRAGEKVIAFFPKIDGGERVPLPADETKRRKVRGVVKWSASSTPDTKHTLQDIRVLVYEVERKETHRVVTGSDGKWEVTIQGDTDVQVNVQNDTLPDGLIGVVSPALPRTFHVNIGNFPYDADDIEFVMPDGTSAKLKGKSERLSIYADKPVIDGNSGSKSWPGRVMGQLPASAVEEGYILQLLDISGATLFTFQGSGRAWPKPVTALPANTDVWVHFPWGVDNPVVDTGSAAAATGAGGGWPESWATLFAGMKQGG